VASWRPPGEPPTGKARRIAGRSPHHTGVAATLANAIQGWLRAEDERDKNNQGEVDEAVEEQLADIAGAVRGIDILAATFDSLHDELLCLPIGPYGVLQPRNGTCARRHRRWLPSARDPYAAASGDFSQDEIDESAGKVVSVKWLDRGTLNGTMFQGSKLLVLYERAIARVYQEPGKTEWKREILAWSKKKRITEDSDIPAGGAPSEKLPWLGAWSEIAPHRATKEGDANFKGSFYVSTTGSSVLTNTGITESLRMDTLSVLRAL
jgi:hypothetical protein